YRVYAGDFEPGLKELRAAQELNPTYEKGYLTQAYAQLGMGRITDAQGTYQKLGTLSPQGASLAASGLADFAAYEGRYTDAIRILEAGLRDDVAAQRSDAAADKLMALAQCQFALNQTAGAISSVEKALTSSRSVKIRFLAARLLASAGETRRAL